MVRVTEVEGAHFRQVKWREGYHIDDVEALLGRVSQSLDAMEQGLRPVVTADQIVDAKFRPTRFILGYDQLEVDEFLDQLAEALRLAERAVPAH